MNEIRTNEKCLIPRSKTYKIRKNCLVALQTDRTCYWWESLDLLSKSSHCSSTAWVHKDFASPEKQIFCTKWWVSNCICQSERNFTERKLISAWIYLLQMGSEKVTVKSFKTPVLILLVSIFETAAQLDSKLKEPFQPCFTISRSILQTTDLHSFLTDPFLHRSIVCSEVLIITEYTPLNTLLILVSILTMNLNWSIKEQ